MIIASILQFIFCILIQFYKNSLKISRITFKSITGNLNNDFIDCIINKIITIIISINNNLFISAISRVIIFIIKLIVTFKNGIPPGKKMARRSNTITPNTIPTTRRT